MKTKIFEGLKTKASAFGFTQAELQEMAEVISTTLTAEATDEQVGTAIDGFIPALKMFQKATTRQIEAVKLKPEPKAADPTPAPQPTDDVSELKKQIKELADLVSGQQTSQLNEKRRALAMDKLKDVPKGYTIGLIERNFDTDDAVETYANSIIEAHKADEATRTQNTAGAYVPGGGKGASDGKTFTKEQAAALLPPNI